MYIFNYNDYTIPASSMAIERCGNNFKKYNNQTH